MEGAEAESDDGIQVGYNNIRRDNTQPLPEPEPVPQQHNHKPHTR